MMRPAQTLLRSLVLGALVSLGLGFFVALRADAAGSSQTLASQPVFDSDTCSSVGFYVGGVNQPVLVDGTNPSSNTVTYPTVGGSYPYALNPFVTVPFASPYPVAPFLGFPYLGYPYNQVSAAETILVGTAALNAQGSGYTAATQSNYSCSAASTCVGVANGSGVVCPGAPAKITLNSSLDSATCGSATSIEAKVVGANGLPVADGTKVSFASTLGTLPAEVATSDGLASASLVMPVATTGTASLTVTAGAVAAEASLKVSC